MKYGTEILKKVQSVILSLPSPPAIEEVPDVVVGLDCTYSGDWGLGVAVLYHREKGILKTASFWAKTSFPYVPTFLSFREIPLLLGALRKLDTPPPLMFVDGQGKLHPRGCGLATHLSKITGVPSVGVAKKLLVGTHEEVEKQKGAWEPVIHENEVIGAAVRTSPRANPIYVSVGDGISLEMAVDSVLKFCGKCKLPEPIRAAHRAAYEKRREIPHN